MVRAGVTRDHCLLLLLLLLLGLLLGLLLRLLLMLLPLSARETCIVLCVLPFLLSPSALCCSVFCVLLPEFYLSQLFLLIVEVEEKGEVVGEGELLRAPLTEIGEARIEEGGT